MTRVASGAVVVIAGVAALVPKPAAIVEHGYSSAIYPALQRAITPVSNLAPFALFDVLCLWAIAATAIVVYRRVRAHGWARGLARTAGVLVVAAAIVYLAFLSLWGLNYARTPMFEKVAFDPSRVTRDAGGALGEWALAELNTDYAAAHRTPAPMDSLREAFQDTLAALGSRAIVPGRPKQTLLGGYFHQIAVAGMTDPFFLETLIAPDLLDVERPFVVAHEWAHLAGYADESEANFIAYLACRHGDATARYSAGLIMIEYARPARKDWLRSLQIGPRIDIYAIQHRYATTSVTLRLAAREGYDTYLKANRVEKGVESYDAVVQLILGTSLDERGYPRRR
jgi:hypothetical protein